MSALQRKKRYATQAEAARAYGVSVRTVRRWMASGRLPSRRFKSGRRRLPRHGLPVVPVPPSGRAMTAGDDFARLAAMRASYEPAMQVVGKVRIAGRVLNKRRVPGAASAHHKRAWLEVRRYERRVIRAMGGMATVEAENIVRLFVRTQVSGDRVVGRIDDLQGSGRLDAEGGRNLRVAALGILAAWAALDGGRRGLTGMAEQAMIPRRKFSRWYGADFAANRRKILKYAARVIALQDSPTGFDGDGRRVPATFHSETPNMAKAVFSA